MALVAVVLQANRQMMPHESFLTMGYVVVLEQKEIKRLMDGVGSHAHLSSSPPCLFIYFPPHKVIYRRPFSLIKRMSLVCSINI